MKSKKKILFSTEIPSAHLEDLEPLVDMHFVIASELIKNKEYFAYYETLETDKPVILDNGMYEEGFPMSCRDLIQIADAINPTVVVAPDQHPHLEATMEQSKEFFYASIGKPWEVGFVPQGENVSEVLACYGLMCAISPYAPIFWSFLNDRPEIMQSLQTYGASSLRVHHHHMLGLYNPAEIKDWPDFIGSMDSVKAIKAARRGLWVEDCPRGIGKWSSTWNLDEDELRMVYRNIAYLHAALTKEVIYG